MAEVRVAPTRPVLRSRHIWSPRARLRQVESIQFGMDLHRQRLQQAKRRLEWLVMGLHEAAK
jgi:hypothetical protein